MWQMRRSRRPRRRSRSRMANWNRRNWNAKRQRQPRVSRIGDNQPLGLRAETRCPRALERPYHPDRTRMPTLKGALHTHTTCSDGQLEPEELVRVYRELGFQFVAITDHDHLLRRDYWDRLPTGDADFLVFKGVELTVFERGYVHVGEIRGDSETLRIFNHPSIYNMSVEKVIDVLAAIDKRLAIDCVEVTHHGRYTPQFDIPELRLSQDRLRRRPFARNVRPRLGHGRLYAREGHDPARNPCRPGDELAARQESGCCGRVGRRSRRLTRSAAVCSTGPPRRPL